MNIQKLYEALTEDEKVELRKLLCQNDVVKKLDSDITLKDWLKVVINQREPCSLRLYNLLNNAIRYNLWGQDILIDEVTEAHFKRLRNAGQKSWQEFVKLRGY